MRFRKCFVCGKEFILAPENIYKVRIKGRVRHLCSWGCLRVLEKQKEAKEVKRGANW